MRTVGIVIVGVVVFVVVVLSGIHLRRTCGESATVLMAVVLTAAWVATPEARDIAAKVRRALENSQWKQDAVAAAINVDPSLLSRWLAAERPMNLVLLLASLDDRFRSAFGAQLVQSSGGCVIEDVRLARILTAVESRAERLWVA